MKDIEGRLERLRDLIRYFEYYYRVEAAPKISDFEFDSLMNRLKKLENKSGVPIPEDSPTRQIGSEFMTLPAHIKEKHDRFYK